MRKRKLFIGMGVVLLVLSLTASECNGADRQESKQVNDQQEIYVKNQPIPRYDFSLSRHLWIQFYDAQNKKVSTFSYITSQLGGAPLFFCPSMGYALPRDTQLTNPFQSRDGNQIAQAEPNGLFTSVNTDATIVFCQNDDGTLAPVYTEMKVTAFPFPVRWEKDHWVRAGDSNISLKADR